VLTNRPLDGPTTGALVVCRVGDIVNPTVEPLAAKDPWGVFLSIPICVFSFGCHLQILPVFAQLQVDVCTDGDFNRDDDATDDDATDGGGSSRDACVGGSNDKGGKSGEEEGGRRRRVERLPEARQGEGRGGGEGEEGGEEAEEEAVVEEIYDDLNGSDKYQWPTDEYRTPRATEEGQHGCGNEAGNEAAGAEAVRIAHDGRGLRCMQSVLVGVVGFCFVFYATVGVTGYVRFGATTKVCHSRLCCPLSCVASTPCLIPFLASQG
jgi:hypothetical protein